MNEETAKRIAGSLENISEELWQIREAVENIDERQHEQE